MILIVEEVLRAISIASLVVKPTSPVKERRVGINSPLITPVAGATPCQPPLLHRSQAAYKPRQQLNLINTFTSRSQVFMRYFLFLFFSFFFFWFSPFTNCKTEINMYDYVSLKTRNYYKSESIPMFGA